MHIDSNINKVHKSVFYRVKKHMNLVNLIQTAKQKKVDIQIILISGKYFDLLNPNICMVNG